MKVCDITQFWSPVSGGVRRYVSEKIRHLRARGGRHVLIVPGERDEVCGDDSARIYTIASPMVSEVTGYRVMLRLGEIGRILSAEQPGIVESGDPYQVGWRVAREGARLGIPAVAFYHSHFVESELRPAGERISPLLGGWLAKLGADYTRSLYNKFARTLVPSPELAAVLSGWGVENVAEVDLGVDVNLFRPDDEPKATIRRRLDLPENACVLLSVGRLAMEKGTRELCEAFAMLAARRPGEFQLVVSGEGLQAHRVASLAAVTGAVTHREFISDPSTLRDLYRAADLFVHPGVCETFGLVTLEAQACGVPVVGFSGTAMDRIVCHDRSFWAREHTPAALADAIENACLRDLRAMGAAAAVRVAARFAWEHVFNAQFDLYAEVMQNMPRS